MDNNKDLNEELKRAIQEAFIYFDQEPKLKIEQYIILLKHHFNGYSIHQVINGIRNGMSGNFGHIQPKLNLHVMSLWITCQIKGCKPNDLKYSKDRL